MVRQSGLGRGLGALLPTNAENPFPSGGRDGQDTIYAEIPLEAIRPNAFQPRTSFDDESLASLTTSIQEIGVLQPVLVRRHSDGHFELIAGERRWRAARRAGLASIPAIIRTAEDAHALEQAIVENLHRADLNPLEEAAAFQQLIDDFSFTHEQVARRVGKSRAVITNTLRLLQLSPAIQRLIVDGQLGAGHARAILATQDKSFQESLARRVVAEALTVRDVEEAVRVRGELSKTHRKPATVNEPRPAGLVELEELLSAHLDTRVGVDLSAKRGRIVIEVADVNDLERIYRKMMGLTEVPAVQMSGPTS